MIHLVSDLKERAGGRAGGKEEEEEDKTVKGGREGGREEGRGDHVALRVKRLGPARIYMLLPNNPIPISQSLASTLALLPSLPPYLHVELALARV